MRTIHFIALVVLLSVASTGHLSSAPTPTYLHWPTDSVSRFGFLHGDDWTTEERGCDGRYKKHVGIDIPVKAGRPVFAAGDGRVTMVSSDGRWGGWITIEHNANQPQVFTTNYFHVNSSVSIGSSVSKGQQIGTVYDLRDNNHCHFGMRFGRYVPISDHGALPATTPCAHKEHIDPVWPELTTNPLNYIDYSTAELRISLTSANYGMYSIRHQSFRGKISQLSTGSTDRQDATFIIRPGLADRRGGTVSLESINFPGYYLRHRNFQVWLDPYRSDSQYKLDATFRLVPGLADRSYTSLEAVTHPGYYIRHSDYLLNIGSGNTPLFRSDATFRIHSAHWQ